MPCNVYTIYTTTSLYKQKHSWNELYHIAHEGDNERKKSSIQLVANSKSVHNLKKKEKKKNKTPLQIVSHVIGIPRILYEKKTRDYMQT